jgi:hypothetical protein
MHFIGWPERRLEWSFPVFYFLSLPVPDRGGGVGDKCTEKERVSERSVGYVVFVLLILEGDSFLVLIPADFDTVESEGGR